VKKPYLDLYETTTGMSNIPGLDGVRAISILTVMLSHSGLRFAPGVLGVTIFFFLSGFLITSLLLDEYGKHAAINIPQFYARRFLRLYPPLLVYIVTVLAGLLFLQRGVDIVGLAGALLYFANYLYAIQTHHIDAFGPHLWSLSVEEHFYLFFPPLLLLLLNKRSPVIVILGVLSVVPLFLRLAVASTTDHLFYPQYTTAATEMRFDSILFGCITAIAVRQPWRVSFINLATRRLTVGCAVVLLLAPEFVPSQFFRQTLRFTLQNFALISLLLTAVYTPSLMAAKLILNNALVRWIAILSYSLYLWHMPVFEVIGRVVVSAPRTLVHVLGWLASFAIAFAIHLIVERPIMRLRKRFGSRGHEDSLPLELPYKEPARG
jgi:peptidoglycan/LPS O-acetylase OafA/YrhL